MKRRERYVVGPTDECAERREDLKRRLFELLDQTRRERERIYTQFWENWRKSHNPDEWRGLGKDPWIAMVIAQRDGVGPDLSTHDEKIRQYDELLRQMDRIPCKEVRKLGRKLGAKGRTRPGEPQKAKGYTDVQEQTGAMLHDLESAALEIGTGAIATGFPEVEEIGAVQEQLIQTLHDIESAPPEIDTSDFEEWLDRHGEGSGPPEIDLSDMIDAMAIDLSSETPEPSPAPTPSPAETATDFPVLDLDIKKELEKLDPRTVEITGKILDGLTGMVTGTKAGKWVEHADNVRKAVESFYSIITDKQYDGEPAAVAARRLSLSLVEMAAGQTFGRVKNLGDLLTLAVRETVRGAFGDEAAAEMPGDIYQAIGFVVSDLAPKSDGIIDPGPAWKYWSGKPEEPQY